MQQLTKNYVNYHQRNDLWCIHQEEKENPEADEEDDAKREVEVKRGERGRGGRRSLVEMLEGI